MKAMLLCAGLGTRLRPMTNHLPKPLAPAPDLPLACHALDRLARAGATEVVINLHHLPDQIIGAVTDTYRDMRIHYSYEIEIMGPTGGIREALVYFGGEPFVVLNGDVYFELDPAALLAHHIESGAAMTMAVKIDDPDSAINAVGFDAGGRVRQLWDAPEWSGPPLARGINIGAFAYSPELIRNFVPESKPYGFREDFFPAVLAAGENVIAFPYTGCWTDIGSLESYLEFLKNILDNRVPGIEGGHYVAESAVISPGVKIIEPCHIAPRCKIGEGAEVGPYTVLGRECEIGSQARVRRSLAITGAVVKPRADICDVVVVDVPEVEE
jgi:NDP-sugar pyrophosphorylase family protein